MKKINLNNPKLGELRFPIELTDAPKNGLVMSANAGKQYENGEVVEGKISKINLNIINYDTALILKNNGGSLNDLATSTVEYIADSNILQQVDIERLIGKVIDLSTAQIGLKWVSRGKSGNWGGIKIILDKLTILTPTQKSKGEQ